jgi:hypothetical protein
VRQEFNTFTISVAVPYRETPASAMLLSESVDHRPISFV